MKRLCVQWPTFGPYHVARLNALAARCSRSEWELTGLETAGSDITGRMQSEDSANYDRVTIFGGRRFQDLPPGLVESGVREALDRLQPTVVAVNSYAFPDARACLQWCLSRGRGAILMTDSREGDAVRLRWREWVKKRIVSQFGAAVVAGSPQRRYIRKLGLHDDRIFDGYDVVDNDYFFSGAEAARDNPEACRDLPGVIEGSPYFLAAARMIERKNYSTLLEGYRRYRSASVDPWRLVILGDGGLRPRIESTIANRQINGITLAGWRGPEDLPVYYGMAGAFVHTAAVDQWGLVVNEAMASGLPVIVSNGSGCVEDLVLGKGSGLTFDPDDADRLAESMSTMSSSTSVRNAMAARAREVISEWSLDRFAESMMRASSIAHSNASSGSITTRILLRTIRAASRKLTSFHSVEA